MTSNKNVSARGNRYSYKEKAKVLSYVDAVNLENGRGGAAAASRKFNISQITISQWLKKQGVKAELEASQISDLPPEEFSQKVARLGSLHEQIVKLEAELSSLKSEYFQLKGSI